jgi:serine protease
MVPLASVGGSLRRHRGHLAPRASVRARGAPGETVAAQLARAGHANYARGDAMSGKSQDRGSRVVIKFYDGVRRSGGRGMQHALAGRLAGTCNQAADHKSALQVRGLFNCLSGKQLTSLIDKAKRRDRTYRPPSFFTYFAIDCPPGTDADQIVKQLSAWRAVEIAYVDTHDDAPASPVTAGTRRMNRGHLAPAPEGIGAEYAWSASGGDGAGQDIIDIEEGWTLDHEGLRAHRPRLLYGTLEDRWRCHGTSVLGLICALDKARRVTGVARNVRSVGVVSHRGDGNSIANAILFACSKLPAGGVLLLEVQVLDRGGRKWPVEVFAANYASIRLATACGLVVVEAGGNGRSDLDAYSDGHGHRIFDRNSNDYRDSGAIMVGAATSAVPHGVWIDSNIGSRINCYASGQQVRTLSSTQREPFSRQRTTASFGGTSSASAIIAGAALAVQGIVQSRFTGRLNGPQMRAVLSNPATGTASNNPPKDRIGVMPNLSAILHGELPHPVPGEPLRVRKARTRRRQLLHRRHS